MRLLATHLSTGRIEVMKAYLAQCKSNFSFLTNFEESLDELFEIVILSDLVEFSECETADVDGELVSLKFGLLAGLSFDRDRTLEEYVSTYNRALEAIGALFPETKVSK